MKRREFSCRTATARSCDARRAATRRQHDDRRMRKLRVAVAFETPIRQYERPRSNAAGGGRFQLAGAECGAERTVLILIRADMQVAGRDRRQQCERDEDDRGSDSRQGARAGESEQHRMADDERRCWRTALRHPYVNRFALRRLQNRPKRVRYRKRRLPRESSAIERHPINFIPRSSSAFIRPSARSTPASPAAARGNR